MSNFLKEVGQPLVYRIIHPLILILARWGVSPNFITFTGFLLNILAAIIFIIGSENSSKNLHYVGWGGLTILFAGLFDMIDGRLARVSRQSSRFGALFDSVIDRYSELVMFLGICYYLESHHYFLSSLFAFIALIGSMMVSYVRARGEGLGIRIDTGWMQRPERILLVGISAVSCGLLEMITGDIKICFPGTNFPLFESITVFTFPIFIMAILTNITAIKRLLDSKVALENPENE